MAGQRAPEVDLRVLGPLEVEADGGLLDPGGPRLRAMLALLAAYAGRPVSVPMFVAQLWDPAPPPDADRTVRTYVSRLRRALGGAGGLIHTRAPGYVLLEPETVDAVRFQRLARAGHAALADGATETARERLTAALGLWRGTAYDEFDGVTALAAERTRLAGMRLEAVQDRIDADLAAGLGGELVSELTDLTTAHPGHERLWGQLMTALYRAGRQADALTAFQRARRELVEYAGVEPSPVLTGIQQRIPGCSPPDPVGHPRRRGRRSCRPSCRDSPGAGPNSPHSTPRPRRNRTRSRSSPCAARRASARRHWPSAGRTASPTASPTGSST
jgi:DNA-binding SARP family transcriptional activator